MQLIVLVDNTTTIDKYYLGKPGLSFYLGDGDEKILFDCGYSNVCRINAERMGVDLSRVTKLCSPTSTTITLEGSHTCRQCFFRQKLLPTPTTSAKKNRGMKAGSIFRVEEEPQQVSDHFTFLGEIPRLNDVEPRVQFGEYASSEAFAPDFVMEDSALTYERSDGIFLITGCSHAGICR
ncbi:MAG: MBL fold metallo-hydrolase [Clostridia bacterium]|nr:MBL fold metallo-hydrolase [Clostridia bacterium]